MKKAKEIIDNAVQGFNSLTKKKTEIDNIKRNAIKVTYTTDAGTSSMFFKTKEDADKFCDELKKSKNSYIDASEFGAFIKSPDEEVRILLNKDKIINIKY